MPAQYDPDAYTPFHTFTYRLTADYFFRPLYAVYHRLSITGRENLPEGPCIIVGNHLSLTDPPLLAAVTKKPIAFMAKEELYTVQGLKQWILAYGAISVDREKPEKSTFKAIKEVFKHGWSLGLFIEGTRSKTPGLLGHPQNGPAYFAKANKVPIVPVGLIGTNVKWGKAYAHIGKPIEPSADLEETSWQVMAALSELTGFALPPRGQVEDSIV